MYPSLASLPFSRASAPVSYGLYDHYEDDDNERMAQQQSYKAKLAEFHAKERAIKEAEAEAEREREAAKQKKRDEEGRKRMERVQATLRKRKEEEEEEQEDEDDDYPKEMR